jgi:hypothetical protein
VTYPRLLVLAGLLLAAGLPDPAAASDDQVLSEFFSIWDQNARVTPQAVDNLYAPNVVYYGRTMTSAGVYADKRAFVRRWPNRRYSVVPGTVKKTCNGPNTRCHVEVTLAYHARSAARGASAGGYTRVSLDMVRQPGGMKIVRESGRRASRPGVD